MTLFVLILKNTYKKGLCELIIVLYIHTQVFIKTQFTLVQVKSYLKL